MHRMDIAQRLASVKETLDQVRHDLAVDLVESIKDGGFSFRHILEQAAEGVRIEKMSDDALRMIERHTPRPVRQSKSPRNY